MSFEKIEKCVIIVDYRCLICKRRYSTWLVEINHKFSDDKILLQWLCKAYSKFPYSN